MKFIGKKAAFPPLGLLTVAALLPEEWPKRLVDVNVDSLTDEDLSWADMAFIGGMAVQRESAKQIIARCNAFEFKSRCRRAAFYCEPENSRRWIISSSTKRNSHLPPFLSDLEADTRKRFTGLRVSAIFATPLFPRGILINMKQYASMSIQFSRGCPFNCEFCNVTTLFGHRPRLKTPQQVIAELDRIYAAGWRSSIFFVDDNFIGNKRYLKTQLLPALIEWRKDKKGCVFFTEASINLADDPELMDMMVKAGFDSVFIGIESPDEASLTECHKTQNKNRDLLQNVRTIHRSGLQVMGGFIVGFDSDTPSIFQRQIDFIQKSGIVTAMVGMLQAPPGTRLFDRLQQESRVVGMFSGDNVDGTTNIIPRMGLDRLMEGYRSIMKQIYSPKNFYRRVRTLLKELKAPEINQPMDIQRFLCIFSLRFPAWVFGQRAFSLLAADALDPDPQAQTDISGHNSINIRLSLP